ncbi:MAG: DUF1656 domain-containing protein [Hansschlegelia sp.]
MIKEIDVLGVFVPPLLLYLGVAALLWQPLRIVLERVGFYRLVWHRALFNLCAFVVVLAGVVAVMK